MNLWGHNSSHTRCCLVLLWDEDKDGCQACGMKTLLDIKEAVYAVACDRCLDAPRKWHLSDQGTLGWGHVVSLGHALPHNSCLPDLRGSIHIVLFLFCFVVFLRECRFPKHFKKAWKVDSESSRNGSSRVMEFAKITWDSSGAGFHGSGTDFSLGERTCERFLRR